jgi:hypothetical protein
LSAGDRDLFTFIVIVVSGCVVWQAKLLERASFSFVRVQALSNAVALVSGNFGGAVCMSVFNLADRLSVTVADSRFEANGATLAAAFYFQVS